MLGDWGALLPPHATAGLERHSTLASPSHSLPHLASARGHFEVVQLVLEAAVMSDGPEKAKRHCIDHCNAKRQTALMVACKHG